MSLVAGSIVVQIEGDVKDLAKASKEARAEIDSIGRKATGTNQFFDGLKNVAGGALTGVSVAAGVAASAVSAFGLKSADAFKQGELKYKTLLGSAEEATKRILEIQDYAAKTPFRFDEIQKGDIILQGFGIRTKKTLSTIGDAAAISGSSFGDLSLIMGQLSQSKDLENIKQLVERGVVSFDELKNAGIKFAKDGSVINSVEETYGKIMGIMETKFAGGADALSSTLSGQLSTALDSVNNKAGQWMISSGAYDGAVQGVKNIITSFESITSWISNNEAVVVTTIGVIGGSFLGLGSALLYFNLMQLGATLGAVGFVPSLLAVAGAGWAAVAPFLPFIAIGTLLIAFLTFLGYSWMTNMFGIRDITTQVFGWISEKVTYLKDHFWETIGMIVGFFATLPIKIPFFIIGAIMTAIDWLSKVDWGGVWNNITTTLGNALKSVIKWFESVDWGSLISGAIKGAANGIMGFLEGALKGALAGIPGIPEIKLPRFANGTRNFKGGSAIINDGTGPEAIGVGDKVYLPRGSDVYNSSQTSDMLDSAGQKVQNISISVGSYLGTAKDKRELARDLVEAINQIQPA